MDNSMNNSIKDSSSRSMSNSIGMEFVLIHAGEFEMGSPIREKRRKLWESPVHRVTIKKPFYLGRYQVTQEQWQKVMGNNPSYFKGAKHPVENVSWNEAQIFFRKLTALEKPMKAIAYIDSLRKPNGSMQPGQGLQPVISSETTNRNLRNMPGFWKIQDSKLMQSV